MKKCKMLISILLAAVMTFSLFSIVPAATAADDNDLSGTSTEDDSNSSKPPAYDPDTATVGQYSINQVDTSILVRHTGRTSELIEQANSARDMTDATKYTDEEYDEMFYTLSCDDDFYTGLGYDAASLKSDARAYAADKNCQNPLSGFGFTDPNELMLGICNASKDFDTDIYTFDNAEVSEAGQLADNYVSNKQNTGLVYFHDDDYTWNVQCSNGIGLDADGDGTDEFAYFSLLEKEDDSNDMQKGSYIRVQLYDRVQAGDSYVWNMVHEYYTYMEYSNYVYGYLYTEENPGYLSLAAGDYNGDGKEELAYYMPDKKNDSDAYDARVIIEEFDPNNNWANNHYAAIHLSDINSDYGKMGYKGYDRDYCLPMVTLSTTSTRLNEVVNTNSDTTAAKRYSTYDDLVISVSPSIIYYDSHLDMNSTTVIYGRTKDGFTCLFKNEYKPFKANLNDDFTDYYRRAMGVSTCDADLNGDGFKELVAAGWMGVIDNSNSQYHTDDTDVNHQASQLDYQAAFVNIISYNTSASDPSNGTYEMLWDQPKLVVQEDQNTYGVFFYPVSYQQIAVCAGHYKTGSPELKDQVCINGVIYDLENTKMTGKPLYYSYQADGTQTNYIADTLPGYDKLNFPFSDDASTGAKGVVFNELYCFNPYTAGLTAETKAGIRTCVSGRFFTDSAVDQIAMISWDIGKDFFGIYMDLAIVSDTSSSGWSCKTYNDILHNRSNKEGGTSAFVAFLDDEEDTAVYRWMGTYCSYTAPALYAILQAPPVYEEANSVYAYEYSIIKGNSTDSATDFSVGFTVGFDTEKTFKKLAGLTVGGGFEFGANYVNNRTWSHDRTLTKTFDVTSGKDVVVCQVTPLVINVYEVYQTKPSAEALAASDQAYASDSEEGKIEHQLYSYSEPQDPVFATMSLSEYNDAVRNAMSSYEQESNLLDPTSSAQIVDPDSLAKSCPGDPAAYNHTYDASFGKIITNGNSTNCGQLEAAVENDGSTEKVGSEFEFGYGTTSEDGYQLHGNLHGKVGFKRKSFDIAVEGALEGEGAHTEGTGNMDGVSFGVTYNTPLPEEQILGGLKFADDQQYTMPQAPYIKHYNPEYSAVDANNIDATADEGGNGSWYNYKSEAVCYTTTFLPSGDFDVMAFGYYTVMKSNQQEDNQAVMGNGSYVENPTPAELNYLYPPEPPEKFAVQSMEYDADGKGSLDVTLIWKSENRNGTRKPDGYNIYMSDANSNESKSIYLENKEGLIYPSQNSAYTTASFRLVQGTYASSDIKFYIVPAYLKEANGSRTVLEGTISAETSIADPYASGKGMVITKQPEVYWMKNDDQSETAVFDIEAVKDDEFLSTEDVNFYWQEYNEDDNKWETVQSVTVEDIGSTPDDPQVFKSSYTVKIDGKNKADYLDKGVRCIVNCSNFSKTSDFVSFYYADERCILLGDARSDRGVDITDVTYIQRAIAKMSMLDDYDEVAADVDADEEVTILDATYIQRYLADMDVPYKIDHFFTVA